MINHRKLKDEEFSQKISRLRTSEEGPGLQRKGGKYRLEITDSSEEEDKHHFDFVHDMEQNHPNEEADKNEEKELDDVQVNEEKKQV